jgi:hypothetical protein
MSLVERVYVVQLCIYVIPEHHRIRAEVVYNRWVQVNPMELPSFSLIYFLWLII